MDHVRRPSSSRVSSYVGRVFETEYNILLVLSISNEKAFDGSRRVELLDLISQTSTWTRTERFTEAGSRWISRWVT